MHTRHGDGLTVLSAAFSLKLEENGSYSQECTAEEQATGVVCQDQRAKFIQIALLIPALQVLSPLFGYILDLTGPVKTAYAQGLAVILGLALILVGTTNTWADPLLFVGFAFVGVNTWLGSLLIIQLGLYFDGHTISRVIFGLNTLFDAGSITYLILWWISRQIASQNAVSITIGAYAAVGAVLYAASAYYWTVTKKTSDESSNDVADAEDGAEEPVIRPSTRYSHFERLDATNNLSEALQNNIPARISRRMSLPNLNLSWHGRRLSLFDNGNASEPLNSPTRRLGVSSELASRSDSNFNNQVAETATKSIENKHGFNIKKEHAASAINTTTYTIVAERPPAQQLRSIPFLLLCLFFGLQVGMCNWNTATQKDFLYQLGDDDHTYLAIFTLMSPISILGSPFIDYTILKFGWTAALQSINILGVVYLSIKVASDNLNVQIVGFLVFSFYRAFLFGITFSFLPSLIAGPVVGKAAGIMTGAAGVVNLCLLPLIRLAVQGEADFFIPNLVVLLLSVPTVIATCVIGRFLGHETAAKEENTDLFGENNDVKIDEAA